MIKKVFKIDHMHCSSCAMDIDGELEDNGASQSYTSYAKSITEVVFDPQKISEKQIIEKIESLGYTASIQE